MGKKRVRPQGYQEFNKNLNFNPSEKPAKILRGWDGGQPIFRHKQIGDSREVYVYKFQHKQAKRKGLRNRRALKQFLLEKMVEEN